MQSENDSGFEADLAGPKRFNREPLNLAKGSSELLVSRLIEMILLYPGKKISFYRKRDKDLLFSFTRENNLLFCNDILGFLEEKRFIVIQIR